MSEQIEKLIFTILGAVTAVIVALALFQQKNTPNQDPVIRRPASKVEAPPSIYPHFFD
jgi:hypothetical protein